MQNDILRRPPLQNHNLIHDLETFFCSVSEKLPNYDYVSITERRCFNLAYHYLVDSSDVPRNFLSNDALLRYHGHLAKHYIQNGVFPKLLILDDLMFHGRGLSKFLYQLEHLIEDDLVSMAKDDLSQAHPWTSLLHDFRHALLASIDISIYAKVKGPLLLEDRYCSRLKGYKTLSVMEMRDLSLQLSDFLMRSGVANTCFVYSEENETLSAQVMESLKQKTSCRFHNDSWRRLSWTYSQETMGLFLRFYGQNDVRHVSSIRFFPGRTKDGCPMRFTSFSMLGPVSSASVDFCCQQINQVLLIDKRTDQADIFAGLSELLQDRTPGTRRSRGQFLYFLLSLIDYYDFCGRFQEFAQSHNPTEETIDTVTDIKKICFNFGHYDELRPAFVELICNISLLSRIKELLSSWVQAHVSGLHALPFGDTSVEPDIEQYNDAAERIFYQIGISAEVNAQRWFSDTHLYHPDSYQDYSSPENNDGVISLADFHVEAERLTDHENHLLLPDLYGRTAALLAIMDFGSIGIRIHQPHKDERQFALCKAGEMSTFYGPKKVAFAIPAFVLLEKFCHRIALTPKTAIIQFCNTIDAAGFEHYLPAKDHASCEQCYLSMVSDMQTFGESCTQMVYRGGQTYQEWDFENLTYRNDAAWLKCQWVLEKQALQFLKLDN